MSSRMRYHSLIVMLALLMIGATIFSGLPVRDDAGFWVGQLGLGLRKAVASGAVDPGGPRAVHSQPRMAATVAWTRQFGSPGQDGATSIAVDPQGNVYVGGWTDGALPGQTSAGSRDAFVRKYTSDGTAVWTRQFGTAQADVAMDVAASTTGDVYVTGQTNGILPGQQRAGESDAFIRKYDANGVEAWTRQFGSTRATAAGHAQAGPAGVVLVTGWVYGALPGQTPAGQYDAFLQLYSPDGAQLVTLQLGTPAHDRPTRPSFDTPGNISMLVESGDDQRQVTARKFDPAGNLLKVSPPRSSGAERMYEAVADPAGDLYAVGLSDTDHGHAFLRKYDGDLNAIWTTELHIAGAEVVAVDVAVDPAGNAYVAGETPAGNHRDAFVQKYTARGTEVWTQLFSTGAETIASGLVVDPGQNVYLAGQTSGTFPGQSSAGLTDAFVAKLK